MDAWQRRRRYGLRVQRLYSMFPAGAPGCGLLALRCAVAWAALAQVRVGEDVTTLQAGAVLVLAAALLLGVYTPIAAGLVALLLLCSLSGASTSVAAGLGMVIALAVILLGPGAYSVDAHRLGRRVVTLARRKERE